MFTSGISHSIQRWQESTCSLWKKPVRGLDHASSLAGESGAALGDIVTSTNQSAGQIRSIATAAEQQAAASEEISSPLTKSTPSPVRRTSALRPRSGHPAAGKSWLCRFPVLSGTTSRHRLAGFHGQKGQRQPFCGCRFSCGVTSFSSCAMLSHWSASANLPSIACNQRLFCCPFTPSQRRCMADCALCGRQ